MAFLAWLKLFGIGLLFLAVYAGYKIIKKKIMNSSIGKYL